MLILAVSAATAVALPSSNASELVLQGDAKTQVDSLETQAAEIQAQIEQLDRDIEKMTERYNEGTIRLNEINGHLVELRRSEAVAKERYRRQEEAVGDRLVAAYKATDNNVLQILLATESFNDLVNRLIVIARLAIHDQDLAQELRETAQELSSIEDAIREEKEAELVLRGTLEADAAVIEERLAERVAVLEGLDQQVAAIIEQERIRQEEERRRLEGELRSRLPNWVMYTGPLPQIDDAVASQLVETAAAYLGIPYLWAGSRPTTGMDCSGFVLYVFAQHGVVLPHFAAYQCAMGTPVTLPDIQAGDIVGFGEPIHHVGIYIGDGLFMHAPHTGDVIRISRLAERTDLTAIRRFPIQARSGPPALD